MSVIHCDRCDRYHDIDYVDHKYIDGVDLCGDCYLEKYTEEEVEEHERLEYQAYKKQIEKNRAKNALIWLEDYSKDMYQLQDKLKAIRTYMIGGLNDS